MTDYNNDPDRYKPPYGQMATPDNPGVKDGQDYYPQPGQTSFGSAGSGYEQNSHPYGNAHQTGASPQGAQQSAMDNSSLSNGQRPVTDSIPGMQSPQGQPQYSPNYDPRPQRPVMDSEAIERALPKLKAPIIMFIVGMVMMLVISPILIFGLGIGAVFGVIDTSSGEVRLGHKIVSGEPHTISEEGTYFVTIAPSDNWTCEATSASGDNFTLQADQQYSQNKDELWMGRGAFAAEEYTVTCTNDNGDTPISMGLVSESDLMSMGMKVLIGLLGGLVIGFIGFCLTLAGAIWWGVRGSKRKKMRQELMGFGA